MDFRSPIMGIQTKKKLRQPPQIQIIYVGTDQLASLGVLLWRPDDDDAEWHHSIRYQIRSPVRKKQVSKKNYFRTLNEWRVQHYFKFGYRVVQCLLLFRFLYRCQLSKRKFQNFVIIHKVHFSCQESSQGLTLYLVFPVIVIVILAMFTFQFCTKLQDKHCRDHYDCDRENEIQCPSFNLSKKIFIER